MSSPQNGRSGLEEHPIADGPLPVFLEWLLGAIIALGGMIPIIGGSAVVFVVDRELLAEGIEAGTVTVTLGTTELTEAEQLELAHTVVSWTGMGLFVTGIGMVLFAIGFVVVRHRSRRRTPADEPVRSYGTFAVLGGVVTVLLSFVPFSPVLGGVLAGYLERGESRRTVSVGVLSGLLPVVPLLVFLVFVFGGLMIGLYTIAQSGVVVVIGATLIFVVMLVAIMGAGLGALGGYVGGRIAEARATS